MSALRQLAVNNQSALDKYQFKPFFGSSHWWAAGVCNRLPANCTVLDIGPGSGCMGQLMKERGSSFLAAVEIDPAAQERAAQIYSAVSDSIVSFKDRRFDLIFLLDILEHLTEPQPFFVEVCKLLAPGGSVLISVPNFAHWSVRIPLMFGHLYSTSRGILDRTHYYHFTYARLSALINSVPGLNTIERASSISPAELALPSWAVNNPFFQAGSRIRSAVANTLPGIAAYQHLAWVKAADSESALRSQ
jgi:SAM-dependent methyltransferase